ncbi:uncharacterized protein N7525_000408, partial [Penicillium rubens]|uniref:uncharacterized protein n=1 Tax=Penicillium rubens TaxID=1108849 RepID=UPI002A59C155
RTVSKIPLNRVLSIASPALEVETRLAYSAPPHTFTGLILFLPPHSSRLRPSRTPTPNDRLSTVPVSCAEMT